VLLIGNSTKPKVVLVAESDKLACSISQPTSGSRARNESRRMFEPDEVWNSGLHLLESSTMVTSWLVLGDQSLLVPPSRTSREAGPVQYEFFSSTPDVITSLDLRSARSTLTKIEQQEANARAAAG